MEFEADIADVLRLAALYERGPAVARRELTRAMERAVKAVERLAKQIVKKDTRLLARSLTSRVVPLGGELRGLVGTNVPYGEEVEKGRPPGRWPAKGELLPWMARHNIPARVEYLIRRKIGLRGIAPAPYLGRALGELRGQIVQEFAAVADRVASSLGAGR